MRRDATIEIPAEDDEQSVCGDRNPALRGHPPTRRQMEVLRACHDLCAQKGAPISTKDLAGHLGTTTATVWDQRRDLAMRGLITWVPYEPHSLRPTAFGLTLLRAHAALDALMGMGQERDDG